MKKLNLRNDLHQMSAAARVARAVLVAIGSLAAWGALAQGGAPQGVPNAMQGFSQNRDKPIQIDAGSLEVRDKDKAATFKDNVKVVQGDTTMRCKVMVVFYEGGASPSTPAPAAKPAMTSATPGPTGSSSIKRLEAKGGVIVTQKDQTVTGETAIFDMKTNTVTMNGGVLLTHGENVVRGDRLVVDMTTGVSKVEGGSHGVSVLLPSAGKGATGGPSSVLGPVPGNEAAPAPKPAPGPSRKPLNLNELTGPGSR